MTKIVEFQPSAFTDQITPDGQELQKLPYPFAAGQDGMVLNQEFWQGDPYRIIGFAKDLAVQEVNLMWFQAWQDPQQAVGMYMVTSDVRGGMGAHVTAIESVEVLG